MLKERREQFACCILQCTETPYQSCLVWCSCACQLQDKYVQATMHFRKHVTTLHSLPITFILQALTTTASPGRQLNVFMFRYTSHSQIVAIPAIWENIVAQTTPWTRGEGIECLLLLGFASCVYTYSIFAGCQHLSRKLPCRAHESHFPPC